MYAGRMYISINVNLDLCGRLVYEMPFFPLGILSDYGHFHFSLTPSMPFKFFYFPHMLVVLGLGHTIQLTFK